jgi:hypothetical protein
MRRSQVVVVLLVALMPPTALASGTPLHAGSLSPALRLEGPRSSPAAVRVATTYSG